MLGQEGGQELIFIRLVEKAAPRKFVALSLLSKDLEGKQLLDNHLLLDR